MKERPILFSGEMVRAILEGRKTQTRRIMKPQPEKLAEYEFIPHIGYVNLSLQSKQIIKPMAFKGDRIWVRETWGIDPNDYGYDEEVRGAFCVYRADWTKENYSNWTEKYHWGWSPSIHMPRWASRITLEVTDVKAERLQDISEEDAKEEGVDKEFRMVIPMNGRPIGATKPYSIPVSYRGGFANKWDHLYKDRGMGWDANPYVFAYTFKRIQ